MKYNPLPYVKQKNEIIGDEKMSISPETNS